ncbi:allantoicase [Rhodovulum sp. DZ06]|uniref:allantoicase n=1 Tax=Rhodovulum sp. DZ06 TaxID=3425126 RepID=UPI003D349259
MTLPPVSDGVIQPEAENPPAWARSGINLASAGLGAEAIAATDEFFAPASRMLADAPAIFYPDLYDDNGKWMDGWESRRRRGPGHDMCVVKLAAPGRIFGFDVDTAHFTGNYPPACRIEGACVDGVPTDKDWAEILPVSPLGASAHHFFTCESRETFTHVRLHIHPDGGVGRLRVYGRPALETGGEEVELAAALGGARIIGYSDAHYGHPWRLLAPGRGENMGDGWETRRRREPGSDWIVIQLAARGRIERALIDTAHFKGNFPDSASIQAADMSAMGRDMGPEMDRAVTVASMFWEELLPPQKLMADHEHDVTGGLKDIGPVTHVRLNIHPDGGISRLKLWGKVE